MRGVCIVFKKIISKKILPVIAAGVLLMTAKPVDAALGDQVLSSGMSNPDINILQESLKDMGHFQIQKTTNYYGYFTEVAVKNFQKAHNIEITGNYDEATHQAFTKAEEARIQELKDNKKLLTYRSDLKLKQTDEDVKLLQEKLKEIGFLKIDKSTTYYGDSTKLAVELFQEAYGLKIDGIAGARTIDTINQVLLGRTPIKEVPTRAPEPKPVSAGAAVVATAGSFRGTPYVYGASGPSSFDCSGFTSYVYRQHGVNLPRTSFSQANAGTYVPRSQLQAGDLIILNGGGHVGIYTGNGQFIHASTSRGVVTDSISSGYYSGRYVTARRVK